MPWLQLHIEASAEDAEALESALLDAGAVSVSFEDRADQPILEPGPGETPLWRDTRVTGMFDAGVDREAVTAGIRTNLDSALPGHSWTPLADREWEREWMRDYRPLDCGGGLWVCPSWLEPPQPEATNVRLDPGLAFGSGTHATTLLCLQWLARQNLEGAQVLDYGCGSGILGIAARLRGAAQVTAVDIDPQALRATEDNARRNGIAPDRLHTWVPEQLPAGESDLVLANILAGPLVSLAPQLTRQTRPGGRLCLSGLLATQEGELHRVYKDAFDLETAGHDGDWLRLAGQRRSG